MQLQCYNLLTVHCGQAEISSVRRAILYEFPFGVNYGWLLLIFALTACYSVICPLITPFGLFYLVMKHGVDRWVWGVGCGVWGVQCVQYRLLSVGCRDCRVGGVR